MSGIGEYPFPQPENEGDRKIIKVINDLISDLKAILNNGISFAENVDCKLVSFTSNGVADTEDTTAHGLGKVPTGFIVYSQDKAGSLYDGGTMNTATNLYTKCDVATVTFKIIVF